MLVSYRTHCKILSVKVLDPFDQIGWGDSKGSNITLMELENLTESIGSNFFSSANFSSHQSNLLVEEGTRQITFSILEPEFLFFCYKILKV